MTNIKEIILAILIIFGVCLLLSLLNVYILN